MLRDYTHYDHMDDALLYDICQDAWSAVRVQYIVMRRQATSEEEREVWSDAIVSGNERFSELAFTDRSEVVSAMQLWDEEALRRVSVILLCF